MTKVRHAGASRNSCLLRNGRDWPARQQFSELVRLCEVEPSGVPGEFTATVNGELLVFSSRTPYTAAARVLLSRGADTNSIIILRHAGRDTNCLVGKLGIVARLTVKEPDRGVIHFTPYIPFPSSPVRASVRPTPLTASAGAVT
jgi:hypothetical protein